MDFLNEYSEKVIDTLQNKIEKLETKIEKKGIFSTKKEKEELEKMKKIYNEKFNWFLRQLDLEFDI